MKKLVTLILVLAGIVSTASADDTYTVVGAVNDEASFFGEKWAPTATANDMVAVGDGTYRKTYSNVELTAGTSITYKVAKDHGWTTTWGGDWTDGNAGFYVDYAGTYDITFIFNPTKTINGDYNVDCKVGNGVYLIYNSGSDWVLGDKVTGTNGVYTFNINNVSDGYLFALVPESGVSGASWNWDRAVRPESASNYQVMIEHMGADKVRSYSNNKVWTVGEAASYILTYDSFHNTFTSDAQITTTVSSAGWATFSLGKSENSHGYTIDGAEAYYVSSTDGTTANLTSIASDAKIPTYPAGILLKKVGGGDVTITTTSTSDAALTGNMLLGSGRYTNWNIDNSGYTGYYLANGTHGVGFYAAETGNMLPYRAFLRVPSGSPAREFFSLDGETTGIEAAKAAQKMNGEFFNLAGQRVAQPTKGLYIVNGKKVIMK